MTNLPTKISFSDVGETLDDKNVSHQDPINTVKVHP